MTNDLKYIVLAKNEIDDATRRLYCDECRGFVIVKIGCLGKRWCVNCNSLLNSNIEYD